PDHGQVQQRSGNDTFEATAIPNPCSDTQIHASDDGETMALSRLDISYAAFADFFGGAGNDTFNLDFTSGVNIIPTAGPNQVSFVGGGGTNRVFISNGFAVTNDDYIFADIQGLDFGPQAGTISFDGRGFTYQNVGPAPGIVDDLTVANRSF